MNSRFDHPDMRNQRNKEHWWAGIALIMVILLAVVTLVDYNDDRLSAFDMNEDPC